MTWWCTATREPWSWSFRAYPGIWAAMIGIGLLYALAWRRRMRDHTPTADDRRRRRFFVLGLATLWLATDWPLGALGAGYLASAHMLQYVLTTLVAAPLLLLGTPEWMARRCTDRLRISRALPWLSKPLVAGIAFNLTLMATHAPVIVDPLRASQFGSMAMDVIWLISGLVLWLPVINPVRELRHPSAPVRCVYLFLACGVIPMIPGGMLTFATYPLYATYELAPRVVDLSATEDQQMAGILMKVGNVPIVWGTMLVIFVRWVRRSEMFDEGARGHPASPPTSTTR